MRTILFCLMAIALCMGSECTGDLDGLLDELMNEVMNEVSFDDLSDDWGDDFCPEWEYDGYDINSG